MSPADPDPKEPPGVPAAGALVGGKYVVERMLGIGGMGAVVAARHATLGQEVAIKVLLREAAQLPDASARFLREAQAVLNIRSEHVARVLDVGTLDSGGPYMVMELLQGEDLAARLVAQGPMPVAEAVDYVLQACEALAEAHSLGIVHRDLKPSNLFLSRRADGSPLVKVLDFGIAKALDRSGPQQKALTATGSMMGSPQYMAPEQVRDSKKVDQRGDVWALGVVLHELLTAQPPFDGESAAAICAAIAADAPRTLRSVLPDAPAELEEVILGCLQKNVSERIPDVGVLARALEPFAEGAARVSIERIVGTVERRRDGAPSVPQPVREASPFAETVASQPGRVLERNAASGEPRPVPASSDGGGPGRTDPREGSVTRSAWAASSFAGPSRAKLAAAAAVSIACVAGVAWALVSSQTTATAQQVAPSASALEARAGAGAPDAPGVVPSAGDPAAASPAGSTARGGVWGGAPSSNARGGVWGGAPSSIEVVPAEPAPEVTSVKPSAEGPARGPSAPTPVHRAPKTPPPPEVPKGGPARDPLGDRK